MMRYLVVLVASALAVTPVAGQTYRFTATGTIGAPYSVDRNFKPIPTPPMTIKAGDAFSISFVIDPAAYGVTGLYDADPTINIYYGSVSEHRVSIGSYVHVLPINSMPFSSAQLWNDYISGGMPVDLFEINALSGIDAMTSPVSLGYGIINETFGLDAFDFTAKARSSDLISQITPLTGFGSLTAYFGFLNPSTYDQTAFSIVGLRASIDGASAVPEPATWAMMLAGFGAAGFALRRRARRVTARVGYSG